MFPILDIGPFAFQSAGLILLVFLWIGIWLTGKFSINLGTHGDAIETGLLYALLAGILGARVGYLLQNPSLFLDNPLSLVSLTPAMLDGSFGLFIAVVTFIIIFQKKHLPLWPSLDTMSPLFILLFTGLHLADYANGDNYGLPTTLPWGIQLWNAARHPVQIYSLLLGVLLFTGLLIKTKIFKQTGFMRSGILFSVTIAGLSLITLLTRAFVAEKAVFIDIDLIQAGALLILATSLFFIYSRVYRTGKHVSVYLSLGSNRKPKENLVKVTAIISEDFKIRTQSGLYKTEDVREKPEKSQFLNRVLEIETDLPYPDLTAWCKDLEGKFGRQAGDKENVPLDVDIIVYNGDVFSFNGKLIPDPNLVRYSYIAIPLAEIAPDFRHPANGKSIQTILASLEKSGQPIQKLTEVENGSQR